MAAPRTRKPKVERLRRFAARVLWLAAWATLPAVAAQPGNRYAPGTLLPDVSIVFEASDAGQRLILDGAWPTPCLPAQVQLRRQGQDLRVEARSTRSLCARFPMPFHFDLDIAAALGSRLEPGLYRVSFYAANAATGPLELREFRLLSIDQQALEPETGFWWPERGGDAGVDAAQGSSLSLERQGDTLAAGLLTYDGDGHADWLFGSGPLQGRSAALTLLGMRDGPSPFGGGGRAPKLSQQASLQLEFFGAARALAWLGWYEQGDGGQPVLRLQALPFVRQSLTGTTDASHWGGRWQLLRDGLPVQNLDFAAPQRQDAEHFVLADPAGWLLTCRQAAARPAAPPEDCALSQSADGETVLLDSIGLESLGGRDRIGGRVRLQRPAR